MAEHYPDADALAARLQDLLSRLFALEGGRIEVTQVSPRRLRMRVGTDRFDLTVVKKRDRLGEPRDAQRGARWVTM